MWPVALQLATIITHPANSPVWSRAHTCRHVAIIASTHTHPWGFIVNTICFDAYMLKQTPQGNQGGVRRWVEWARQLSRCAHKVVLCLLLLFGAEVHQAHPCHPGLSPEVFYILCSVAKPICKSNPTSEHHQIWLECLISALLLWECLLAQQKERRANLFAQIE